MTDTSKSETRREQLRRKVAQSQETLARTPPAARMPGNAPPEGYKALAIEYPFALIAGGLALGAVAGALLPRSVVRKLAQGAIGMAGIAGDVGLAYGRKALETAGDLSDDGRGKLGDLGKKLSDLHLGEKLTVLGEDAGKSAGIYGRKAADIAGKAAELAADAAGIAVDAAGKAAGSASDLAGKAAEAASDAADSTRGTALGIAKQVIRLTSHLRH